MTEPAEFNARPKIIGARVQRTEDPRLLTGRAKCRAAAQTNSSSG